MTVTRVYPAASECQSHPCKCSPSCICGQTCECKDGGQCVCGTNCECRQDTCKA